MDRIRLIELLEVFQDHFDRCSNPFCWQVLHDNNVTSNECQELSQYIADLIEWQVELLKEKQEGKNNALHKT